MSPISVSGDQPPSSLSFDAALARAIPVRALSRGLHNAIVHGLSAYGLRAPWWLVVAVSVIAPAELGSVVYLAVLVGRTPVADYEDTGIVETRSRRGELVDEHGISRASEIAPAAPAEPGEDPDDPRRPSEVRRV